MYFAENMYEIQLQNFEYLFFDRRYGYAGSFVVTGNTSVTLWYYYKKFE
jgi:hypothetical protein